MGTKKLKLSHKHALPFATANKFKRQDLYIKHRKVRGADQHKKRHERRREEDRDPTLREQRLKNHVPTTLDRKRTWDAMDAEAEEPLGMSVDAERLKRLRMEELTALERAPFEGDGDRENEDADSMLDSESDDEGKGQTQDNATTSNERSQKSSRASSPIQSTTSTNFDSTPEGLAARFPGLFNMDLQRAPKVLVTTSLNSTLHDQAQLLTALFPNSTYIRRSAHRYGHKYSIREISKFASNRDYTILAILNEDQKRPSGLDIVHLPNGPMFHFSMTNWVEGKRLPGHGNATNHYPELILNNFRTPLGLLTAHVFRHMFPPKPEFQGRQVVTLHNQRDFIFFRRHRYVFRDKRASEKAVVGNDGKEIKGAEDIRAGLQELGPRFTLKLRRIDKAIQRASGQEWEWKGKTDRVRTKFQL